MVRMQFLGPDLLLIRLGLASKRLHAHTLVALYRALHILDAAADRNVDDKFPYQVRDFPFGHFCSSTPTFQFVLFDWRNAEILAVFNRCSNRLFDMFVNFSGE